MRAFIVADTHGQFRLLHRLLEKAEIVRGIERDPGAADQVIHIGDLANAVLEDARGDFDCLTQGAGWFDKVLVGNHEHPFFGGPDFSGFWPVPEVREAVFSLARMGVMRPCALVDDVLLTHAGVVTLLGEEEGFQSPSDAFVTLEAAWQSDPTHRYFSSIGFLRGGSGVGGVLWADDQEAKTEAFNQVYGHTPGKDVREHRYENGNWSICIDKGGKGRLAPLRHVAGGWKAGGIRGGYETLGL